MAKSNFVKIKSSSEIKTIDFPNEEIKKKLENRRNLSNLKSSIKNRKKNRSEILRPEMAEIKNKMEFKNLVDEILSHTLFQRMDDDFPNSKTIYRNLQEYYETQTNFIISEILAQFLTSITRETTLIDLCYVEDLAVSKEGSYARYSSEADTAENTFVVFANKALLKEDLEAIRSSLCRQMTQDSTLEFEFGFIAGRKTISKGETRYNVKLRAGHGDVCRSFTHAYAVMHGTTFARQLEALNALRHTRFAETVLDPRNLEAPTGNWAGAEGEELVRVFDEVAGRNSLNRHQAEALGACLDGEAFSLVQGPPGTGKTRLVGAIVDMCFSLGKRVLVLAQSNQAVDHICRVLRGSPFHGDGVLINRVGRKTGIAEDIHDMVDCGLGEGTKGARAHIAGNCRIFCATVNGCLLPWLPKGFFDVIIVDEASQVVEVSSLIPLLYAAGKHIFIGDPKQLPPTILSNNRSFERTLYDRLLVARPSKLLRAQYRMPERISDLSSALFYGGEIATVGKDGSMPPGVREAFRHLDLRLFFPFCFIDVGGREEAHESSFCNRAEVDAVRKILSPAFFDHFLANRLYETTSIGVITPYRRQANLISAGLRQHMVGIPPQHRKCIKINTVDAFQGQEMDVILFSAVRTTYSGFLKDQRRMNVAITRSKYGLFVIGCDEVLRDDENWNYFINEATKTGNRIFYKA